MVDFKKIRDDAAKKKAGTTAGNGQSVGVSVAVPPSAPVPKEAGLVEGLTSMPALSAEFEVPAPSIRRPTMPFAGSPPPSVSPAPAPAEAAPAQSVRAPTPSVRPPRPVSIAPKPADPAPASTATPQSKMPVPRDVLEKMIDERMPGVIPKVVDYILTNPQLL